MNEKLIALSVPVFFVSMIAEFFLNRRHLSKNPQPARLGTGGYRFSDTFCNLACGIGNQLFDPVLRVGGFAAYAFMYTHGPMLFRGHGAAEWIVGFVGVDFFYYWFHRASHRVNLLWAAHAVHHQSEEYNLSVALRQPWLEKILDVPFYLPLAFLGVSPEVYMTSFTINLIYQFFLHASFVPKLGAAEYLFNTPSHHRVHHGIDPQYIDKNYGGMLIVWDRLFGSFEEERAPVHFGTVKPLASYDPLWANLAVWTQLAKIAGATGRSVDKFRIFVAPPEWLPRDHGGPVVVPPVSAARRLFDPAAPTRARILAGVALIASSGALVWFLEVQSTLPMASLVGALALAVMVLSATGRGLDQH